MWNWLPLSKKNLTMALQHDVCWVIQLLFLLFDINFWALGSAMVHVLTPGCCICFFFFGSSEGNVKGKDCILIDDMMDTGTTIIRAAERLKKAGARRVYVYVCHGLFSGTSWASVSKNTAIDEVIVSNTIPANRFR